jgi:hypothetical protein
VRDQRTVPRNLIEIGALPRGHDHAVEPALLGRRHAIRLPAPGRQTLCARRRNNHLEPPRPHLDDHSVARCALFAAIPQMREPLCPVPPPCISAMATKLTRKKEKPRGEDRFLAQWFFLLDKVCAAYGFFVNRSGRHWRSRVRWITANSDWHHPANCEVPVVSSGKEGKRDRFTIWTVITDLTSDAAFENIDPMGDAPAFACTSTDGRMEPRIAHGQELEEPNTGSNCHSPRDSH